MTTSSTLSTEVLQSFVDQLRLQKYRKSMQLSYFKVWQNFNEFFIKLDQKPDSWEQRLTLFVAFLINKNRKSNTIKSYISAIKALLLNIGVELNQDQVLLTALTRACKINNDRVATKIPIRKELLSLLISKLDKLYLDENPQQYLATLYKALFCTAYYGLFRINELTKSQHVIRAIDVHIATNKEKLMFVLHSSKTHMPGGKPQIIKLSATAHNNNHFVDRTTCPFQHLQEFLKLRRRRACNEEQFFIFSDRSPVLARHVSQLLALLLK